MKSGLTKILPIGVYLIANLQTNAALADHVADGCEFDRKTEISAIYADIDDVSHTCLNIQLNSTNQDTGNFILSKGARIKCLSALEYDGIYSNSDLNFELHIENGFLDGSVLEVERCLIRRPN